MKQVRYAAILLAKDGLPRTVGNAAPHTSTSLKLKKGRIRETKNARLPFRIHCPMDGKCPGTKFRLPTRQGVVYREGGLGLEAGGTDSPTSENRKAYTVNIQLNDTVYVCRVDSVQEKELEHYEGKELPVRVNGKTLDVKELGDKVVTLGVVGTKKAE